MTDTNQQTPSEREAFEAFAQNCPMGKYSITRRGDGYDSSHTQLMWDAWQARAQVQGAPIGEVGTMPGTSGFTMACFRADEIPVGTKLYTTQQPAHATQADVTDAAIDAVTIQQWGDQRGAPLQAHRAYARAILALRPAAVPMTGWQPIETAPNTGPFLAVLDCGGDQTICTMRHGVIASKNSRPDGDFIRERVTHWMPLPPFPKSTQAGITAQAKKEGA